MAKSNLTIGKRIGLLSGSFIMVLLVSVFLSVNGVGKIVRNAEEVINGNRVDAVLAQKEVDHLNWVNKVNALFTDQRVKTLEVETDDHKCGFGRWLYGEERKQAEQLVPAIAPLLKEIEAPHLQLHTSAIEIGKQFRQTDRTLGSFLREKKIDHLIWINRLKDALINPQANTINVEMDPNQCGLGRWLLSDQVTAMSATDTAFNNGIAAIKGPHEQLHRSAAEIKRRLAESDHDGANAHYFNQTQTSADQTLKAIDSLIAYQERAMEGIRAAEAVYAQQSIPALRDVQKLLAQIRTKARESILTDEAMLSAAHSTRRNVMLLGLAAVLFGLALAVFISRGISRSLRVVADGIEEASSQVASAAAQISAASQSLADGAAEQAASMEETSVSIQQISTRGKETSELTQGAEKLMNQNIEKSAQSLKSLIDLTRQISQIEADSDEIGNIIKTIDQIAFQTNLLALNAAVEAARAGEAGAGFAVVAEEVRNLAMRAAEAARHTQVLLDGTLKRATDAAASIRDVNVDFEQIIESATLMGERTSAITQASVHQAESLQQMTHAMGEIEKVTQQMAAGSEQAAASSEELSAQAEEMILIVADLARMVYGNHKGVPRATESSVSCWEVKNCPPDRRDSCPAYPSHGSQCWTVTGTLCGGQKQGSYQMKMDNCRKCDVYKLVKGDGNPRRLPVVKGSPKEHP